jgi:Rrf2 family protein
VKNLVKISEAATLALHTMSTLAANPDRRVPAREIAELFKVSEAHLAKVLQRLGKAGLVASTRGPRGGFTLSKKPGRITLLAVFEAVEGPLGFRSCLFAKKMCKGDHCVMGTALQEANQVLRDYLTNTTLEGFAPAS